jgi:regulator of replication initiation timing
MAFGFALGKSSSTVKLIRKYVKERVKENQTLNDQLERLDAQLEDKTIDKYTYERLRDVLEINSIKQREEALEKAFLKSK